MDESLKWFLRTKAGREFLIEKSLEATPKEKNWQSFHTPYDLCEKMILKTDVKGKSILVLFNIEFVKVLIEKFGVHSNNITFLADCRLESEMATKTFHVNNIVVHNIEDIQEVLKNMGKQFDLCFSNPPYGKKSEHFHIKILLLIENICKEILYLHPIKWAMTIEVKENITENVRNTLNGKIKEIEIYHPDVFPDNEIPDFLSVTHIVTNKTFSKMKINFLGKEYKASKFDEISIYTDAWNNIIQPFQSIMKEIVNKQGNIYGEKTSKGWNHWQHYIKLNQKEIPENKHYCMFPATTRKSTKDLTANEILNGGLEAAFPIIPLEIEKYIHTEDEIKNGSQSYLAYWFETPTEVVNFLNYLKTPFAKFCLSISRGNNSLFDGALSLIPTLDFTQSWTDEKLYDSFNIPQEIIDYITNFFKEKEAKE